MRSMNMQIFVDWDREQAFNVTQSWPGIPKSQDRWTTEAGI